MSKKDKSKFKRLIKAQLATQMTQAQSAQIQPIKKGSILPQKNNTTITPAPEMAISKPNTAVVSPAFSEGEINLAQIKYDLKKTGVIMGILAVMLGAIYYINLKHDILLTFGNWLFKVLHIG